jgi:ADP-ribose pyrophosphatase YjhB (NUDIX family)
MHASGVRAVTYHNPVPAAGALIDAAGKLLLARRGIEPCRGMWDIPGGFLEAPSARPVRRPGSWWS